MGLLFGLILLAYLFGSIGSAIIVCKLMRLPDPRTLGSRNPGATNVLRIGGKVPAIITLLADMLKGFVPVLIAKLLGVPLSALGWVALAAFFGHLYPVFFRFEGGKGVATLLGTLIVLSWPSALCWLGAWLIIFLLSRYVSLASLLASAFVPIFVWYFTFNSWCVLAVTIMVVALIYRHRGNIDKLIAGDENKFGKKE